MLIRIEPAFLKSEDSRWGSDMSPVKKDRKIRSATGRSIPTEDIEGPLGNNRFAQIVSDALRRQFEGSRSSVKMVVRLTNANERAVKNWFLAKNAPRGAHLIALMRHSDEILETVLILAGREELLTAKKLADALQQLENLLKTISDLSKR